jgi:hypothetical protein
MRSEIEVIQSLTGIRQTHHVLGMAVHDVHWSLVETMRSVGIKVNALFVRSPRLIHPATMTSDEYVSGPSPESDIIWY